MSGLQSLSDKHMTRMNQTPYWNKENPFAGNYARGVDHVYKPKKVQPSSPRLASNQYSYPKQYSMATQMARAFMKYKPHVSKLL